MSTYIDVLVTAPNGTSQKVTLSPMRYNGETDTVASAAVIHVNKQEKSINRFVISMSYDRNLTPRIETKVNGQAPTPAGFVDFDASGSGIWTSLPAREGRFRTFGKYRVQVSEIYDREMLQAVNPSAKTFRATPAQSNCYGLDDFNKCVSDFEAGIVRPGYKDE